MHYIRTRENNSQSEHFSKKNSVPGSWYMISFYHPFDSRIPLYPLSSGDTAMHRRRATIYYRIPITLPSTSIGQVNFKVWLV